MDTSHYLLAGIGKLFHRGSNGDARLSRDPRDWDVNIARDWWSKHVLGKTFVECRSFLMIYRCVRISLKPLSEYKVCMGHSTRNMASTRP